ncbi:MAG: methyl-accepting chemotaxis protein, partial [Xanthobacteraceae bacterium]
MAISLFRKRDRDPVTAGQTPPAATAEPAVANAAPEAGAPNAAADILDLLEVELQAMVRQLERAASSVAGGAQSTAETLTAIRSRAEALTGQTQEAQFT